MLNRPALVYSYDGSFDGLLCCVFESYQNKELPIEVLPEYALLPMLLPVKPIPTDEEKARRVQKSIPGKMGREALLFIKRAYLTCHPQKHSLILRFLRLGYRHGASVLNMLTDDTVHTLTSAVRHLQNEAHLYLGFVRFSEYNGALTAQIEPKNIVLPLIAHHFCERYAGERFLIHDKTHGMALIYQDGQWAITDIEAFSLPCPSDEEIKFRTLWRLFYDTIEIKGRHNPRCRQSHMPKRYWRCLTEMSREDEAALPAPDDRRSQLCEPKDKI